MARLHGTGLRRPLLIYFIAVVGPTLVVLTIGILAVRRQAEAVRVLAGTTARLHEQRVQDEIERLQRTSAASFLADASVQQLAARLPSAFAPSLDALRLELAIVLRRHPVVREVFVAGPDGVLYPRLHPPLPADDRQSELDAAAPRVDAVEHWRRVAAAADNEYSRDGRPLPVLAAMELRRLSSTDRGLVDNVRADLENGRWSITPDQHDYLLSNFGGSTPARPTSFQQLLGFVRRLHAAFPAGHAVRGAGPELATISHEGVTDLLALARSGDSPLMIGASLDSAWIADRARRIVGDEITNSHAALHISPPQGQAVPFRAGPLPWHVTVRPVAAAPWQRRDVFAFGGGAAAILGVLIMGVVLLARDVGREAELNRLRADLVSGVSHELKAPLSVIRMYAETIREASSGEDSAHGQFAETIVQETDRLHRLIDDVVDFSRIQQGRRVYRIAAGDLGSLVKRTAAHFSEYARLHGLHLDTDVAAALPAVSFDASSIQQAIMNLLDNAAKYSGDSTTIRLRVFRAGAEVAIEVADQGIGIAGENQVWIFDRFRRGAHPDRGGYGLGLYLVRHIVEAHGGRIDVWSEAGMGSRFTLYLPVSQAQAAHA